MSRLRKYPKGNEKIALKIFCLMKEVFKFCLDT